MESSNIPEAEFKILGIKMLDELRGRQMNTVKTLTKNRKHKNGDRRQKRISQKCRVQ